MDATHLPPLKRLIPAVLATMGRSRNIGPVDCHLQRSFHLGALDAGLLKRYIDYFGFPVQDKVPLSFLYLVAQRAQIALMLDRRFGLPLPGIVHFDNHLLLHSEIDPRAGFLLEVSAFIQAKAEGSLFPVLSVDFFQEGRQVAACKSGYFVRRKRSGKKKERKEEVFSFPVAYEEPWRLPGRTGWEYARLSGDFNPIHLSRLFARLAGFRSRIIHGWYSLSRGVAAIQKQSGAPFWSIDVNFKKPLFIPGRALLRYGPAEEQQVDFLVGDEAEEEVFLVGRGGF
jgi:hypothetical protein